MDGSFWLWPPVVLAWLAVIVLVVLGIARLVDQAKGDRGRPVYKLSFPSELSEDQVLAYVVSFSGTLRSKARVLGSANLVFEVLATELGKHYRVWLPGGYDSYTGKMLRAHIPGIRMEPDDNSLPRWNRVAELRQTSATRKLRNDKSEVTSTTLRGSMHDLRKGESVLMQLVVSPAVPLGKPSTAGAQKNGLPSKVAALTIDRDKIAEQREKLSEANFDVGLRIAAAATTDQRAKKLVRDVNSGLASMRTAYTGFRQRIILPPERLTRRTEVARGPFVFQITVTGTELVALMAWPIGDGYMPGVPRTRSKQLPPSPLIPPDGRVLAHSNYAGGGLPLTILPEDACKHLHVVGPTGVGKTTLLANLLAQDMENEAGVVVIDSKGDKENLFVQALAQVPASRVQDVIVMDVSDQEYPVGFNLLAQGSPSAVLSDLQAIFNSIYSKGGVRVPAQFFHGLMALMTSRAATQPLTFVDLVPLFSPASKEHEAFGDIIIRDMPDDFQRNWWQIADNRNRTARDAFFNPSMERIWQLNNRPEIRHIIGQSESSFTMRDVVRQRKILLVNLAGMGEEIPSLLGSMLVNALWNAVRGNAGDPAQPTFLYLDEFHKFTHLPISLADMLAAARGFGLAMVLANQNLGQLTVPEVRDAVMSNARSKVVFQNDADARVLADMFGKPVTAEDIKHLGNHDVIMRLAQGGVVNEPVTGHTLKPPKAHGLEAVVRRESRKRYGRPVAEVAKEIRERPLLIAGVRPASAGRLPKLGPQPWDD